MTSPLDPEKALSVKQPWAGMIMSGRKIYEIRSRRTKYRGRLWICSSAKIDTKMAQHYAGEPLGFLLGYVDLVNCVPYIDNPLMRRLAGEVPYRHGLWAWKFGPKVTRLETPKPVKGNLGIFTLKLQEAA